MNDFKIVFKPSVYQEIQDIIDYYNLQSENLGERFLQKLSEKFEKLKVNPFLEVRYKNSRMATLDTFPYVVHFEIFEKSSIILILAVLHGHINPEKYLRRNS